MEIRKQLQENMRRSIEAKSRFLEDARRVEVFVKSVSVVVESYFRGGRLFIAGNGGSAADAQHLAAEFVSKLARDRNPLPAEALTTDTSILTAIGNDYGFEHVFARQLLGKANPNDVFLGITTSGRSVNIIRAVQACTRLGIPSIVFSGRDGGDVASLCDYCVIATGELTSTIQEVHIVLAHTLCGAVEQAVFPE
jgi:D-sedoheptulose 7-phosphate isomerase